MIVKDIDVELTADEKAGFLAIDFANEVQYSNEFFAILADTYAAHPFTIGTEMFKDKDVILGVAAALEAILPSETVKVLARTGLNMAYTLGFNPTMKVSMGIALPLFAESQTSGTLNL